MRVVAVVVGGLLAVQVPGGPLGAAQRATSVPPTEDPAGASSAPLFTATGASSTVLQFSAPITGEVLADVRVAGDALSTIRLRALDENLGGGRLGRGLLLGGGVGPAGMTILDFGDESWSYVQVEVNGIGDVAWVVTLYPLDPSLVSAWTGEEPLVGSGNAVAYYTGAGGLLDYRFSEDDLLWSLATWAADGTGPLDAIAGTITSSGSDGTTSIAAGPLYLLVAASGDWSLTPEPAD
jgi:hypothetical protein